MSILIQTTHFYSAIIYLHHGTCTIFHSLTNDNIHSFFFGNPKLLDPILDGWHVYTDLLVGYPITRKDRHFFKVWVYTSQIWIADWSTFSNHVVKINGCCMFLFTVLLQKQHWKTLTWVLLCDFLMKRRFQLCKHREKLYVNYVNEITWYRWPIIHKTTLKCCPIWLVRKADLDWDLPSGANRILGDSAMGRHIGKHRTRHRDINYHHTKDV